VTREKRAAVALWTVVFQVTIVFCMFPACSVACLAGFQTVCYDAYGIGLATLDDVDRERLADPVVRVVRAKLAMSNREKAFLRLAALLG
jgi:hypothetical protein